MTYTLYYKSPVGQIAISGSETHIEVIVFDDARIEAANKPQPQPQPQPHWAQQVIEQLDQYFKGQRAVFDLPLNPQGTAFQNRVWKALRCIHYGEIESYQSLATRVGDANHSRAVATANAKNPIAIVIPCHRVIGKDDALRGYAGGVFRKSYLLELEGNQVDGDPNQASSKVVKVSQLSFTD